MPVNVIGQLDQTGVMIDTPSIALPPNAFSNVRNVRFDNAAANKMPGHKQVFDYWELDPDDNTYENVRNVTEEFGYDLRQQAERSGLMIQQNDDIIFCRYWPSPAGALYVFATTERVYIITPEGVVYDVSRRNADDMPTNFTARGELDASWDSTLFAGGQAFIMNNGVNVPHYMIFEGNAFDRDQRTEALQGLQLRPLPGWSYYYSNLPTVSRENDASFLSQGVTDGTTTRYTFLGADGTPQAITASEGAANVMGSQNAFAVFLDNTRVGPSDYTLTVDHITFDTAPTAGQTLRVFRHTIGIPTIDDVPAADFDQDRYAVLFSDAESPEGATVDPEFYTLSRTEFMYDIPSSGMVTDDFWNHVYRLRGLDLFVGRRIRTTAGILRGFENVLIAGNLTEINEDDESTIRRIAGTIRVSNLALPGQVPTSWDPFSSQADTADEFELSSTGVVREMVPLQGQLIIYTSGSIHSMQLTQNIQTPVLVGNITDVYGTIATNCVHEFDGQHVVVGSNDIYIFPGHPANITSIADRRVRDYFFNNLHPVYTDRIQIVRNRAQDEIWVGYPTYDSFNGDMTEALIWNYRYNTWTIRDLPNTRSMAVGPVTGGGVPAGTVEIREAADNNLQNGIRALFPGNLPLQELQIDPDAYVYTRFADRPSHQRIYINDIDPYDRPQNEEFDIVLAGNAGPDVEATHYELRINPADTFMYSRTVDTFETLWRYEDIHYTDATGTTPNITVNVRTISAESQSDEAGETAESFEARDIFRWQSIQPQMIPDTTPGAPAGAMIPNPAYAPEPMDGEMVTMARYWEGLSHYVNNRHTPGTTRDWPFVTWGMTYPGTGTVVHIDSAVRGARRFNIESTTPTILDQTLIEIGSGIFNRDPTMTHLYAPARSVVTYTRDGTEIFSDIANWNLGTGNPQSPEPGAYTPVSGRELYNELLTDFNSADSQIVRDNFQLIQDAETGQIRMIARQPGAVLDDLRFRIVGAFTDASGAELTGPAYTAVQIADGLPITLFKTLDGAFIGERTDTIFEGTAADPNLQPPILQLTFPEPVEVTAGNFERTVIVPAGGNGQDEGTIAARIAAVVNLIPGWTATADNTDVNWARVDLVADENGPVGTPDINGNETLFSVNVMNPSDNTVTNMDFDVRSIRQGTLDASRDASEFTPVTLTIREPQNGVEVEIPLESTTVNEIDAAGIAQRIATSTEWTMADADGNPQTVWQPRQAGAYAQWVLPAGPSVMGDSIVYTPMLDGNALAQQTITPTVGTTAQELAVMIRDQINALTGISATAPGTAATQVFRDVTYDLYPFARSSALVLSSETVGLGAAVDIVWNTFRFGTNTMGPDTIFNTSDDSTLQDVVFLSTSGADVGRGMTVTVNYGTSGTTPNMLGPSNSVLSPVINPEVNPFDTTNRWNSDFGFSNYVIRTGSPPQFYGYPTTFLLEFSLNSDEIQNFINENGRPPTFEEQTQIFGVVIGNQDPDYRPRITQEVLYLPDPNDQDIQQIVNFGDTVFQQTVDPMFGPFDMDGGVIIRPGETVPIRIGVDGPEGQSTACSEGVRGRELDISEIVAFDANGQRLTTMSSAVTAYQGNPMTGITDIDTQGSILGRAVQSVSDFRITFPSNQQRMFQFFSGQLNETRVLSIDTSFNGGRRVVNRGDGIPVNYHDGMQPFVGDRSLGTRAEGGLDDSASRFRTNYDSERPWAEDTVNDAREFIVLLDRAQSCLFAADLSLKFGSFGPGGVDEQTRPNETMIEQNGMNVVVPLQLSHLNGPYESVIERTELIMQDEVHTFNPMAFYFRVQGDVPDFLTEDRRDEANKLYLRLFAHDSPGAYIRREPNADPMVTEFQIGFSYKLDTRIDGRLLHLRVSDMPVGGYGPEFEPFNWSLTGIDVDVEQTGRR